MAVIFSRKELRKGFRAGEGNTKWLWKVSFNLGVSKYGGRRERVSNFSVGHGYIYIYMCVVFNGGIKLLFLCGERQKVHPSVACTISILLVEILMVFKHLHFSSDNV
jgi:hypothetical protein